MAKRRSYKRDRKGRFAGGDVGGGSGSSGSGRKSGSSALAASRARSALKKANAEPLTPGAHMRAMNDPLRQARIKAAFNGMKMPTAPVKLPPASPTLGADMRARNNALRALGKEPGAFKKGRRVDRLETAALIKDYRNRIRAAKASGNVGGTYGPVASAKRQIADLRSRFKNSSVFQQNKHKIKF